MVAPLAGRVIGPRRSSELRTDRHKGLVQQAPPPEIPDEDFRRLSEKAKAAGLWCLGVSEEYGGGGLDTFSMSVVLEEMAQHRSPYLSSSACRPAR